MFDLEKTFHFEAGHALTHHDGKCRQPHGHSYKLTIHIRSTELHSSGSKTNMVVDFSDITSLVNPMINQFFDHHWINETLQTDSPTAEFMAQWIYHYLKPHLPLLHAVTLHETNTSKVTYSLSKNL